VPPEHSLKPRGCVLHLVNDLLTLHLSKGEQGIVEGESMPTPSRITVLAEDGCAACQTLLTFRQAARSQVAPDRRCACPTSVEAEPAASRF
jgi:hypothetical protein